MKYLSFIFALSVLISCGSEDPEADAYGNFEATELFISAEVNGKLLSMQPSQGDRLEKGAPIALIDSTQSYLKRRQFEATIQALRSKLQDVPVQLEVYTRRLRNLEREEKRVRSLLADSAATRKQLDDLIGELQVVRSQIVAAESQLSTANRGILAEIKPLEWQLAQVEDLLSKSVLRSPITGTILEIFKQPGELISVGQPLVKLADLDRMILRGYVSGDQLGKLSIGQKVAIKVDEEAEKFRSYPATVTWVSPRAEFTPKVIQTRDERVNLVYAVKFQVENDGFLKIGMPGEVLFSPQTTNR